MNSFVPAEEGRSVLCGVDYPGCQVDDVGVYQGDIIEARNIKSNRRNDEYNRKANEPSDCFNQVDIKGDEYSTNLLCLRRSSEVAMLEKKASSTPLMASTGIYHIQAARTFGALVDRYLDGSNRCKKMGR